jgi:hypothetical protein
VLQNAGLLLISIHFEFCIVLRFIPLIFSFFTPSVHAVVLLAESHPNSSALKVFAADACDASCRAASEVTAGVAH